MNIHLIRHGKTATSGRSYAGRTDIALTLEGTAQAQGLARMLSSAPICVVVTSPLRRARDTARPIAKRHGLEPITDPDLSEFDFGVFEGMAKAAVGLRLRKTHLTEPVPEGESLALLWTRTGRFARRLRTLWQGPGDAVIVGHFWSNRLLFGHLTGLAFETACRDRDYRPGPGSITTLAGRSAEGPAVPARR